MRYESSGQVAGVPTRRVRTQLLRSCAAPVSASEVGVGREERGAAEVVTMVAVVVMVGRGVEVVFGAGLGIESWRVLSSLPRR